MIVKLLSRVQLFATPWTVANQAPPSMRFSRQEYWSGLPFPSPTISLDMHKVLVTQSCQTLCDPMANIKTYRFIGNFSFHCT